MNRYRARAGAGRVRGGRYVPAREYRRGADLTWCVRLVERVTLDLETLKAVPA